jgi:hypothetical protein
MVRFFYSRRVGGLRNTALLDSEGFLGTSFIHREPELKMVIFNKKIYLLKMVRSFHSRRVGGGERFEIRRIS